MKRPIALIILSSLAITLPALATGPLRASQEKPCGKAPATQVARVSDGTPCCWKASNGKRYSSTYKNDACKKPATLILCLLNLGKPEDSAIA